MTFGARTFQGFSQGTVISFDPSMSNNSVAKGIRSAQVALVSDGTGTHLVLNVVQPLAWYAPTPTVGAGSIVWVKWTTTSSALTTVSGSTVGSVITAGGAGWTVTSTSTTGEGTGAFTLSFYGDSGGTNLLMTVNGTWHVGYTP